jgi:chemotaxis signal transduction protein
MFWPITRRRALTGPMTDHVPTAALLVRLGERQYGVPLTAVERVLPMASVLPLPGSDASLLGVLNLRGNVLPVVNPHPRLGLPTPAIAAEQRLILVNLQSPFLVWVDEVDEVVEFAANAVSTVPGQHQTPLVQRVMRLGETLVPMLSLGALGPGSSGG